MNCNYSLLLTLMVFVVAGNLGQQRTKELDHILVEFSGCSIQMPTSFKEIEVQGKDSLVKKYKSEGGAEFNLDMGLYSDLPVAANEMPRTKFLLIAKGRKGTVVEYRLNQDNTATAHLYAWAVYFRNVRRGGIGLSMTLRALSRADRNSALGIFRSLRCR